MPAQIRKIILAIVILLAVGVIARPYIPFLSPESGEKGAISVTPQPYSAYEEALQEGKPIFLEFYASW